MRKKAHIFLTGIIGDPDFFGFTPTFNAADVRRMISENSDAEDIIVHIDSNGGLVNEAFTIHDILQNSGKGIETVGEGMVASAATIVFLAGKKRKITKYSTVMIHTPFGIVEGDAEDLEKAADEMQRIQDKLAKFYEDKTGNPASKFDKWMKEETYMNADEALEMGFATEILEPLKAVATLSTQQNQTFNMKNLISEIRTMFKDFKAELTGTAKNLDLTTADAKTLRVDTVNSDAEVGDQCTIENQPASDGEYIIPAINKKLTIAGGKITNIADSGEAGAGGSEGGNTDDTPEVKDLKAQILAKDQKINEISGKLTEHENALQEFKTEITSFKTLIASNYIPKGRTQNFGGKTDEPEVNRVELAKQKKEEREAKKAQGKK